MNEVDILNKAIHNLENIIPIIWNWKAVGFNNDIGVDGELEITINNKNILMFVEIKKYYLFTFRQCSLFVNKCY